MWHYFDTILECDSHTHRHTMTTYTASIAAGGKNHGSFTMNCDILNLEFMLMHVNISTCSLQSAAV